MKRLLIITAFPPNKNTAGQNYTRNLISDLSNDFLVDVVYWHYPNHEIIHDPNVNSYYCIKPIWLNRLLGYLLLLFPLFSRRFSYKSLKYIRSIAKEYDALYFDFSQLFVYSLFIKHPLKIGMAHDVIIQKYSRTKLGRFFKPWIRWSEGKCLSGLHTVYTFSYKDQNILETEYGIKASTVPFYIEPKISNINLERMKISNYFVMYGAWNRRENQESILWFLNHYPYNKPRVKIIGGSMPESIKVRIAQYPNIEYIGFIANPYLLIAQSKGLIAPLFHGAGVKVKAVESLALGTPIIGTDITFEGLPQIENSMLKIDNKKSFIEALSQCDKMSVDDKLLIQALFREKYTLKTFKQQLLSYI